MKPKTRNHTARNNTGAWSGEFSTREERNLVWLGFLFLPPVCMHLCVFMRVGAWGWHQWHQQWFWIALHWARLSQSTPGLANIAGLTSQLVLGTLSPGFEAGIRHGHPCPLGIYVDPGNWTLFLRMLPLCFGGHIPVSALAFLTPSLLLGSWLPFLKFMLFFKARLFPVGVWEM